MRYIVDTVEDFFAKLDRMQQELAKFSQEIDDRSEKIPALLRNFEKAVFDSSENMKLSSKNAVDKAAQNSLANLRTSIESWRHKIEQDRKGREFIQKNEKYLVVMIFGAVKTGKSSLGNFFAGQKFLTAPFDNRYKHIAPPVFETEERGRNSGDVEKDENGNTWFSEGVTDTTGTIQYFTLSGLRWVDSPGTGAVEKDGDYKDMTKLVEEYLPYTDMCIFLMNSSEPGLQDDMRYMNELNKQGQEALIVITRSDKKEEDVDDEGNLISVTIPKTPENRKLQEDDCCKRVKKAYPNIDVEKFRAISISTLLAQEAIAENDDEKYKASNLDKLMQILGNKVSDNAIARKQENPRRLLNGFIEQILSDLGGINDDLNKMQVAVNKYKNGMKALANIIVSNVKREVRIEITRLSNDWNRQVNHGGKFDTTNVNKSISQVVQEKLNKEINRQMTEVIEDYEQQELPHVQANLEVGTLEKKTATIKHIYTESYTVERDPDGIIETIRGWFGKKYRTIRTREHTEEETIDIGTNIDKFMEDLMPQVEQFSRDEATASLKMLENSYFHQQEQLVGKMRQEISHLEDKLNKLKV